MLPLNLDEDDEWEYDMSDIQSIIFLKTKKYGRLQGKKSISQ